MPRKPDNWPFDQAPNVAAISEPAVIYDSVPILLVVHYSDDHSWAFLAGTDFRAANGKVIAMGEALRLDPTLREIADLEPGWVATRERVGAHWTRQHDPDV